MLMDQDNQMQQHSQQVDLALEASIQGYPDIAEDLLRQRIKEQPDDLRVLFNLGWHDLRQGKFKQGMEGLASGRMLNVFGNQPINGQIWHPSLPLKGKILLYRCEGGLGDEIMNLRFAKKFEDLGARVIVSCTYHLMGFFAQNGYMTVANEAVNHGKVYYDYWVPAMSAPVVLDMEYKDLSGKPYLTAPTRDLYERPGTIKIGIKWSGNPKFEHEQHRRFPPELLINLHNTPNTTFYSLQRDEDTREFLPFGDLKDQMFNWESTASILQSLDLVITSCTSIAHCAGALGKETWVVVPTLPYYCWALPGNTSPWYDSVRLFRQEKYGDWEAPFAEIKAALEERVQLKLAA